MCIAPAEKQRSGESENQIVEKSIVERAEAFPLTEDSGSRSTRAVRMEGRSGRFRADSGYATRCAQVDDQIPPRQLEENLQLRIALSDDVSSSIREGSGQRRGAWSRVPVEAPTYSIRLKETLARRVRQADPSALPAIRVRKGTVGLLKNPRNLTLGDSGRPVGGTTGRPESPRHLEEDFFNSPTVTR